MAYNYGAFECLDVLFRMLRPGGFVLLNDYGRVPAEEQAEPSGEQQFGRFTAMGLNFPLLERWLERRGVEALKPEGEDARPHHARLFGRSVLPGTRAAFEKRFSAAERGKAEAPVAEARRLAEMGRAREALERSVDAHECYLQAERIYPRDVNTNLNLAQSWLALGDPGRSLEAVARGLANDSRGMFRHLLLERQQHALGALSVRWNAERAMAVRR